MAFFPCSFETDHTVNVRPEKQRIGDTTDNHVVSRRPLVHLYKNCITENEKNELLKLAEQRLTAETDSGSSSSLYLQEKSDAKLLILRQVAKLAGVVSGLPWRLAEPVALTKYISGQNYGLHYDSGFHMQGKRVKRTATFLVYLNDVERGGETIFPYATNDTTQNVDKINIIKTPIKEVCSADHKDTLKISPKARNCILFYNHLLNNVDGVLDSRSLHGSCPVLSGEKLIAQIWLHDEPWGKTTTTFWTD